MSPPPSQPSVIDALRCRFDLEVPHTRRNAIMVYRDFVALHEALINEIPEAVKDDGLAIRHRQAGNRAFSSLEFGTALGEYNRSICCAESGSEQLGIGYGYRSAIYYELGEYEFALYNIDLARKHNYPDQLLPKLIVREINCKKRIAEDHSENRVTDSIMDINVDVNPNIPILANGIDMKQYEDMGRGLVAVHDFNNGDVILDEKIDLYFGSFERSYTNCAHCGKEFRGSLIPCPGCTAFMYCGKNCLEQDFRAVHRFECCVATKLRGVTYSNMLITARLFFHGLTLFKDNVNEYMNYCWSSAAIGSKPLDLDFSYPDPLEVFKTLHQVKPNRNRAMEHLLKLSVATFQAVFLKNPLIQSKFYTAAHRNAMLRCLLIHGRVALTLLLNQRDADSNWLGTLSPIASLLNHSCDPNAVAVTDSGRTKIILLRPIQRGDQITINYVPTWWNAHDGTELAFLCKCIACDGGPEGAKWRQARDQINPISAEAKLELCSIGEEVAVLGKFQRIVQILARDGHHPGGMFDGMVKMYRERVIEEVRQQGERRDRVKVFRSVGRGDVFGHGSG